jgi:polysaccharide pyruvyl transferase WcaK-like protein
MYTRMLAPIDRIVLREDWSYQIAKRLGLNAHSGFDLLAAHIQRQKVSSATTKNNVIVLGGGLGLDHSIFFESLEKNKTLFTNFRLRYITGALSYPARDDVNLINTIKALSFSVEHKVVSSFMEWANEISTCRGLISGRFHHTIAAAALGTPSLVFQSNTPKVEALCEKIGMEPPLNGRKNSAINESSARIRRLLTKQVQPVNKSLVVNLVQASKKNFCGL